MHEGLSPFAPARKKHRHCRCFFQRNKSLRICEIRFACEILLRNVKCLRAWVDLFYFTWCVSIKFHNLQSKLFHICRKTNISLKMWEFKVIRKKAARTGGLLCLIFVWQLNPHSYYSLIRFYHSPAHIFRYAICKGVRADCLNSLFLFLQYISSSLNIHLQYLCRLIKQNWNIIQLLNNSY